MGCCESARKSAQDAQFTLQIAQARIATNGLPKAPDSARDSSGPPSAKRSVSWDKKVDLLPPAPDKPAEDNAEARKPSSLPDLSAAELPPPPAQRPVHRRTNSMGSLGPEKRRGSLTERHVAQVEESSAAASSLSLGDIYDRIPEMKALANGDRVNPINIPNDIANISGETFKLIHSIFQLFNFCRTRTPWLVAFALYLKVVEARLFTNAKSFFSNKPDVNSQLEKVLKPIETKVRQLARKGKFLAYLVAASDRKELYRFEKDLTRAIEKIFPGTLAGLREKDRVSDASSATSPANANAGMPLATSRLEAGERASLSTLLSVLRDRDRSMEEDTRLQLACRPLDFSEDIEQSLKRYQETTRTRLINQFSAWLGYPAVAVTNDPAAQIRTNGKYETGTTWSDLYNHSTRITPGKSTSSTSIGESKSAAIGKAPSTAAMSEFEGENPLQDEPAAAQPDHSGVPDASSNLLCISAASGTGKTVLSGVLCDRFADQMIAVHFRRDDHSGSRSPARMTRSLAAQLAQRIPDYRVQLLAQLRQRSESLDDHDVSSLFETLIVQPLKAVPHPDEFVDKRAVILFDGFDSDDQSFVELLSDALMGLPAWISVAVTAEPEADIRTHLSGWNPYFLSSTEAEDAADVKTFLIHRLLPLLQQGIDLQTASEKLAIRSRGVFLHAHMVVEGWNQGSLDLEEVDGLPKSVEHLWLLMLKRWRDAVDVPTYEGLMQVLQVLCAAYEPITIGMLQHVLQIQDINVLNKTLEVLRPWLVRQTPTDGNAAFTRLSLYHCSIRSFLTQPILNAPGASVDEQYGYVNDQIGHQKLLKCCLDVLVAENLSKAASFAVLPAHQLGGKANSAHSLEISGPITPRPAFSRLRVEDALKSLDDEKSLLFYAVRFTPAHSLQTSDWVAAVDVLCNLQYVELRTATREGHLIAREISQVIRVIEDEGRRSVLISFATFCRTELPNFRNCPVMCYPCAFAYPDVTAVYFQAHNLRPWWHPRVIGQQGYWIEWLNKPREDDPLLMTLESPVGKCAPSLCLVCSADGGMIISAQANYPTSLSVIHFWDATSGELMNSIPLDGGVADMSCSKDGLFLAVASDMSVLIISLENGTILHTLDGHSSTVNAVSYSPTSNVVVSGSSDRSIRVWDAAAGALLSTLYGHSDEILCVTHSPDGETIASGGRDGTIRLWTASTYAQQLCMTDDEGDITSLTFSEDGGLIMNGTRPVESTGDSSNIAGVRVWDPQTGDELLHVSFPISDPTNHRVTRAEFVNGSFIVTNRDNALLIYDGTTGDVLKSFVVPSELITFCCLQDGRVVASTGSRSAQTFNPLRIWDMNAVHSLSFVEEKSPARDPLRDRISCANFSLDGRFAVACGEDESIRVWDVLTGRELHRFKGPTHARCATISPDGQKVATVDRKRFGAVRLFSVTTGKYIEPLPRNHAIASTCFAPDGKSLICASDDGGAHIVSTEMVVSPVKRVIIHKSSCYRAIYSPDGRYIATFTSDYHMRIWSVESGEQLKMISLPDGVLEACFSPDGSRLAAVCDDSELRVWDWAAGVETRLDGHMLGDADVVFITFSSDGSRVVSGCLDTGICAWEVATGNALFVLYHPQGLVAAHAAGDSTITCIGAPNCMIYQWKSDSTLFPIDHVKWLSRAERSHGTHSLRFAVHDV